MLFTRILNGFLSKQRSASSSIRGDWYTWFCCYFYYLFCSIELRINILRKCSLAINLWHQFVRFFAYMGFRLWRIFCAFQNFESGYSSWCIIDYLSHWRTVPFVVYSLTCMSDVKNKCIVNGDNISTGKYRLNAYLETTDNLNTLAPPIVCAIRF